MHKTQLKIKIKSLAKESQIIRFEEKKLFNKIKENNKKNDSLNILRENLFIHRTHKVRKEIRHSLLAYALIRNIPYKKIEVKCKNKPNFSKVMSMAYRFGFKETDLMFDWIKEAEKYL